VARLILAALTLALTCTPNIANDLATPPPATTRQLITITTPSARSSHASARVWERVAGCWFKAGGPGARPYIAIAGSS